jgi:beta-aspartyl-peptidase (threonine type)
MDRPFIAGTDNSEAFLPIGSRLLTDGASAIDAVEATIRAVEENPDDHSVGIGGIPNLLGVIQLDASIMEGRTRAAGAVAAIEGFLHPISIARMVMEVSPHVLLVGEGGEAFAEAMGFERTELGTEYSEAFFQAFLEDTMERLGPGYRMDLGWLRDDWKAHDIRMWYERLEGHMHGTVNVLAMDSGGDICSGVSTSGTYMKLPGRVGDSPIIGAGNYCDNRYGAAACVGKGELSIRHGTARTIVLLMQRGLSVEEACVQAMAEVLEMAEDAQLDCLAFDKEGETFSASTYHEPVYYAMDVEHEHAEERRGVRVSG